MNMKKSFVVVALFSVVICFNAAAADEPAMSAKGEGVFTNAPALLIDGAVVPEQTPWDDERCVNWVEKSTFFVIDLGKSCIVKNMLLQADHNDNYIVEYSENAETWMPLFTNKADEVGEKIGMRSVSTDSENQFFQVGTAFAPVTARFIKLHAADGDEAYSISEIIVTREDVPVEEKAVAVETTGDETTGDKTLGVEASGEETTGETDATEPK